FYQFELALNHENEHLNRSFSTQIRMINLNPWFKRIYLSLNELIHHPNRVSGTQVRIVARILL
ncbi:hypothetical protein RZN22_09155, partial [Bacillaceae bacterium S4-13-58]